MTPGRDVRPDQLAGLGGEAAGDPHPGDRLGVLDLAAGERRRRRTGRRTRDARWTRARVAARRDRGGCDRGRGHATESRRPETSRLGWPVMAKYWYCVKHHRVEAGGRVSADRPARALRHRGGGRRTRWRRPRSATSSGTTTRTGATSRAGPASRSGALRRRSEPAAAVAASTAPGPARRISPLPFGGMIGLACVLFLDLGTAGVLRVVGRGAAGGGLAGAVRPRLRLVDAASRAGCPGWPRSGLVLWLLVVVGVNVVSAVGRAVPAGRGVAPRPSRNTATGYSQPLAVAMRTASERLPAPVLPIAAERWLRTVPGGEVHAAARWPRRTPRRRARAAPRSRARSAASRRRPGCPWPAPGRRPAAPGAPGVRRRRAGRPGCP